MLRKKLAEIAVSSDSGAPSLRVATYNIHGFVGMDGRRQPDRIHRVLEEIRADVVALQEVDCFETANSLTAQWLGEMHSCQFETIPGPTLLRSPNGPFGNAIVTSLDVDEIRRLDISVHRKEPRGILDVCLRKEGRPFRVLATHLGLRWAERKIQMRRLMKQILAGPVDTPLILLGDLNEPFPFCRGLRRLRRIMGHMHTIPSFPSPFPVFALDRIIVRPHTALHSIRLHRTPLSKRASDHLPLKADILLHPE